MARTYTLKRRAEAQAETRRRIVEAALELHGSVGPAATSYAMLAARAGVQRHTLYAHFPDERSLLLACSGLATERDPMPDASGWAAIADPETRLRTGLAALYAWFARNAELTACVLRDAEQNPLVREIAGLRSGPPLATCRAALGGGLDPRQQALLAVALGFHSWRTLTRDEGLAPAEAAATMAAAIAATGRAGPAEALPPP